MNKPFFSIITINYNSGVMIKDTIESVINQDFKNFEYIIIDGKSNDESLKIINSYNEKGAIQKLISEKDKGIYDAMNKGVEIAEGEFLYFLNADDFLIEKDILTKVYNFIVDNSEYDIYYGDLLMVKQNNVNKIVRNWINRENENERLIKGGQITQPSSFLKRSIFEEIKFKFYKNGE